VALHPPGPDGLRERDQILEGEGSWPDSISNLLRYVMAAKHLRLKKFEAFEKNIVERLALMHMDTRNPARGRLAVERRHTNRAWNHPALPSGLI